MNYMQRLQNIVVDFVFKLLKGRCSIVATLLALLTVFLIQIFCLWQCVHTVSVIQALLTL